MTTLRRYVRQVVAPNGRHRKPVEPTPPQAEPVPHEDSTEAPEPAGVRDE
ncbi:MULTISPECIES: hypothetical protein [Streptomyces]|nr:hypothetical protein [Streptomyces sp. LBUM 1486]